MNRMYRQVWNHRLHALQVASEVARPRGSAASGASASVVHRHPLAFACVAALALGMSALPAYAITILGADLERAGRRQRGAQAGRRRDVRLRHRTTGRVVRV